MSTSFFFIPKSQRLCLRQFRDFYLNNIKRQTIKIIKNFVILIFSPIYVLLDDPYKETNRILSLYVIAAESTAPNNAYISFPLLSSKCNFSS